MAILLNGKHKGVQVWYDSLKTIDEILDIRLLDNIGNPDEIDFIISWGFKKGFFDQFKNLQVICSVGAGIDHILRDDSIKDEIKIVKIVDDKLTNSMWEYCLSAVTNYVMRFDIYEKQQKQNLWKPYFPKSFSNTTIGVVGIGSIGGEVARNFTRLGFNVKGYANSKKNLEGVDTYSKVDGIDSFLEDVDIVIGILPLTPDTKEFYNKKFFNSMKKGSVLINVGRGAQIQEDDLIKSLANNHLRGAMLDVFKKEPLPEDSPLWNNHKINITPHIASITNAKSVAPQVIKNYNNMIKRNPLNNLIDRVKGY
jgi:glyoxylate/hydroxypyruvate reductase A